MQNRFIFSKVEYRMEVAPKHGKISHSDLIILVRWMIYLGMLGVHGEQRGR